MPAPGPVDRRLDPGLHKEESSNKGRNEVRERKSQRVGKIRKTRDEKEEKRDTK